MGARKTRGSKPEDLEELGAERPGRPGEANECSGQASPAVKHEEHGEPAMQVEARSCEGGETSCGADASEGEASSQCANAPGDAVGACGADGRDGMEGVGASESVGAMALDTPAQTEENSVPPWDEEGAYAGEWDDPADMADDADVDESDLRIGLEHAADVNVPDSMRGLAGEERAGNEPVDNDLVGDELTGDNPVGDNMACSQMSEDDLDEDVARAQALLGGCWREDGSAVLTCPENAEDESGGEDDLGRFDIHDPHQLGELGEHIAARYLRMYDYKILERNYRCHQGEADIICTKDDSIVLVEVKTRLGADAHPEDAVNASKLLRYKRITLEYLMSHEWFENVRLDVLAVNIVEAHRAQVHHFVGVCAWEG